VTVEADARDHYATYEHWLVLNPADQIVEVGQLLAQQVRIVEYLAPQYAGSLAEFEPDLSCMRANG
jgi:hypothetical protein